MKNKYLKEKEFDINMPVKERRERAFITAIELFDIQTAILEYLLHATQLEQLEIYAILKQELEKQSLFPL